MKKPQNRQLKKTQLLIGAILGVDRMRSKNFKKVLKALSDGMTDIVVEVPWYEDGGFHQILLQHRQGDRIYFINPAHSKKPVGASLKGKLPRRIEENGLESVLVSDLEDLFKSEGAGALLPRTGTAELEVE